MALEVLDGSSTVTAPGKQIAACLVAAERLSREDLTYGLRVHGKVSGKSLITVLTELRLVDAAQIQWALRSGQVQAPFGDILVELGHLSDSDLRLPLSMHTEATGTRLAEVLAENNLVPTPVAFGVLADLLGVRVVLPATATLDADLLRRASMRLYETHSFLPLAVEGDQILVAFAEPQNPAALDQARRCFGANIAVGLAPRRDIAAAITRAQDLTTRVHDAPSVTVDAVNEILRAALARGASDIHFEPTRSCLRVRLRRDGTLMPYREIPLKDAPAVVNRIKVLAGADIAERRRHQDGRLVYNTERGPIDIRMSIYVTVHGEKVVLRLLNNRDTLMSLNDIGMSPRMERYFQQDVLDAPSGVVIITGPTGSGKTTTLYAGVNYLNNARTSIITAEDPVEYFIDGISQCSINSKINLSYNESLRHIMRQDPDVIVIGEIRDEFSAEVAINAALTGHKVLTTFHTEDSIGGLVRLMNMNIESFLISSTIVSVVAQRLLRRVCNNCGEEHRLSAQHVRRLGYRPTDIEGLTFRQGRGCDACQHTGYRGRVAVFELLVLNEPIRDAILSRKTSYEIRRVSLESSGLVTLLEDGIAKGIRGLISFEDIIRQLPRLAPPRLPDEIARLHGDAS